MKVKHQMKYTGQGYMQAKYHMIHTSQGLNNTAFHFVVQFQPDLPQGIPFKF